MKNFNERIKAQLEDIKMDTQKEREAFARFREEKQAELDSLEIERKENETVISEAVAKGDNQRWSDAVQKRNYYRERKEFLESEMNKRPEVSEKTAERLQELAKIREELNEKMKNHFPYVIREAIKEDQGLRDLCDSAKNLQYSLNNTFYGTNGYGFFDTLEPGTCFNRLNVAARNADAYDSPAHTGIWI